MQCRDCVSGFQNAGLSHGLAGDGKVAIPHLSQDHRNPRVKLYRVFPERERIITAEGARCSAAELGLFAIELQLGIVETLQHET